MANICIMASGQGTNAKNIIEYFKESDVNINFIVTDRVCGASQVAFDYGIDHTILFDWKSLIDTVKEYKPDLVILAGFLKLIPNEFLDEFKVINIHPSLLPKFGGRGMWGQNVHNAVIESGEVESGITIHWVNSEYDKGDIIAQFSCLLDSSDTPETLQSKIKEIELKYFPKVVKQVLLTL